MSPNQVIPFFERFVAEVRRLQGERSGVFVAFTMQTNGVLIDAEWARFLKREGFLLGVSIDGPRLLHDAFRVRRDDTGTFAAVMAGVAFLRGGACR